MSETEKVINPAAIAEVKPELDVEMQADVKED